MDYKDDIERMLRQLDKVARTRVRAAGIASVDVEAIVLSVRDFPDCCTTT